MTTTREERRRKNRADCQLAYMGNHRTALELLERIQTAIANHDFPGADPESINWGHVGSLSHVRENLQQISDFMFNEGEYAG